MRPSPPGPEPSSPDQLASRPLTDSAWFWTLVFSTFAAVALLLVASRYDQRQAPLDRRYQAQQQASVSAREQVNVAPSGRLVPLWPLAAIVGATWLISVAMLVRTRTRHAPVGDRR